MKMIMIIISHYPFTWFFVELPKITISCIEFLSLRLRYEMRRFLHSTYEENQSKKRTTFGGKENHWYKKNIKIRNLA